MERVLKTDAYFKDNITFNTITFISELHIKSQFEIEEFFTKLPENINKIPVLIRVSHSHNLLHYKYYNYVIIMLWLIML